MMDKHAIGKTITWIWCDGLGCYLFKIFVTGKDSNMDIE